MDSFKRAGLCGTLVAGRLTEIRAEDFCVSWERGEKVLKRWIEFRAFSTKTGEPSQVWKDLQDCKSGDWVAVAVWLTIHGNGVSRRTGQPYGAFASYEAMTVTKLEDGE